MKLLCEALEDEQKQPCGSLCPSPALSESWKQHPGWAQRPLHQHVSACLTLGSVGWEGNGALGYLCHWLMQRAGLKATLRRTCRGDGDRVTARREGQCRSHGSGLQDLQRPFQGLSKGRGSVPAAAAFGGLDGLVKLIFLANLHFTRYKPSLCWSSSSVQCSLWAEVISGGSQEQPQGEGMSSRAWHARGRAGEHLQRSLVCSHSLCWATQCLKLGQMMSSWPRVKSQEDQRIHQQGRWDGCQHTHTGLGDTRVSAGGDKDWLCVCC